MTGIIILAAGPSSRLGTPKQNLVYQGQTLLQRAIKTALKSACKPVMVVLGANYEGIRTTIKDSRVRIIYNQDWAEGMASSIRSGIKIIRQLQPEITSVVLMLCDQPFVSAGLLNELVEKKSKAGIVAASYNQTFGPPALFDMLYFDDLLSLKGAEGAKRVIQKYPDKVIEIPFPQGSIDIDTMEDFETINRQ